MLLELAHYLASLASTPPGFRRHLRGAVGLWSRGRRQSAAWAPHIEATRRLIEASIATLPSRRTVAILGSGPLFDVPLETLAAAFDTVILVDHAHLATVRRRARRLPNIRFLWRDLSAADPLAFLAAIPDLDWVVSVNLVSQLGTGAPPGSERATIDAHLAALASLPCPTTLVTDIAYQRVDRYGAVIEDFDLLHGYPMPAGTEQWLWEVAPLGEEERHARRVHHVAFYPDWHADSRCKTDIESR